MGAGRCPVCGARTVIIKPKYLLCGGCRKVKWEYSNLRSLVKGKRWKTYEV